MHYMIKVVMNFYQQQIIKIFIVICSSPPLRWLTIAAGKISKKYYWYLLLQPEAFNRLYVFPFMLSDRISDEMNASYLDFALVIE